MTLIAPRSARAARLAALAAGLAALGACSITPRHDREWLPYLENVAHVEQDGDAVGVSPVTDWSYDAQGPVEQCQREASFDIGALERAWFVIEPRPGSNLVAHTFLLFEFDGDQLEGLTIEARREAHETYSAVRGVFRAYELSYLWGSARDLLTRRAVYLDHEVFIYPLALTDEQERILLTSLLARTAELEERPRFYNTFWSNCTNELAKAVDLDWHRSFILTGGSDDHLFRSGLIPGESFAQANARADMTEVIKRLNKDVEADEFDAAILAELRRRLGETETKVALTD